MITYDLFPPKLRKAPVEEQLQYLLQRRTAVEKLLRSLERYVHDRDRALRVVQSPARTSEAA